MGFEVLISDLDIDERKKREAEEVLPLRNPDERGIRGKQQPLL